MAKRIDPYRIGGESGRGGIGMVYRATDPRLDRVVAIATRRQRSRMWP